MTQPVKLHILPPNHTGPVMQEPGAGPGLRSPIITGGHSMARMAIHQGTLYTDTPPDQWQPVDADRAAALGYGPSDPWPFPDRIEVRQDTSARLQQEGKDSWKSFPYELCAQFSPSKLSFSGWAHGWRGDDLLLEWRAGSGVRHSLTVTRADHERWDDDTLARKIMLALKEGRTTLQ